jgi:hypothetical protein
MMSDDEKFDCSSRKDVLADSRAGVAALRDETLERSIARPSVVRQK